MDPKNTLKKDEDLFNNPMTNMAKKALTPEQILEYKKIGEYMYNSDIYKQTEFLPAVEQGTDQDYLLSAEESLKSGLLPTELSKKELDILMKIHGKEWYLKFGFSKDEVKDLCDQKIISSLPRQLRRKIQKKNE
jgi:hypothetical protein